MQSKYTAYCWTIFVKTLLPYRGVPLYIFCVSFHAIEFNPLLCCVRCNVFYHAIKCIYDITIIIITVASKCFGSTNTLVLEQVIITYIYIIHVPAKIDLLLETYFYYMIICREYLIACFSIVIVSTGFKIDILNKDSIFFKID